MRHFLSIDMLSVHDVTSMMQRAQMFMSGHVPRMVSPMIVAHLFYENSTRTRISFELAARRLGMIVVNFDVKTSSDSKGEDLVDTLQTLVALGVNIVVMRHSESGLPQALEKVCGDKVQMINAGDGQNEHPTQAMIDLWTIMLEKPDLRSLKIAVVGNIRHSRVVHSFERLCALMGVGELVLVAPKLWQPPCRGYGRVTDSLHDGLASADVVMALRVQRERLSSDEQLDLVDYHRDFALTTTHLSIAKPDAMVMHPGPINRGIEIDSEVADGPQSFILKQVKHGVWMRMAILNALM